MDQLRSTRVLVTGASSGIGQAIARALAAEGASVAVLARREPLVASLADELGGVAVVGDVTDLRGARVLVDHAAAGLGGLDALVNSAGIMRPGLVAEADPQDWRDMFDTNVLGLLAVTQGAVPHLRASGCGTIVNISSMSGRRLTGPLAGVYAATKFAVHAIGEALRLELQPDGIRVTTIAPGFVDTPIFEPLPAGPEAEQFRDAAATLGMRPEDVAAAVVHALAAPPGVTTVEIALLPTAQV